MRVRLFLLISLAGWLIAASPESPPSSPEEAPPGWGDASTSSELESTWSQARQALEKERYRLATTLLARIVRAEPRNADALNLLGFSNRKLGRYPQAMAYYRRALAVDPDHRQAIEYMAEAHLALGERDKAEALLARLRELCPDGCRERSMLEAALKPATAEE